MEATCDLELLGLGVAKCTIRQGDRARLDVSTYGDVREKEDMPVVRRLTFLSESGAIGFPGRFTLSSPLGDRLDLDVARAGGHGFSVTVRRADEVLARGLGLLDPDDSDSLMVSWWTGEREPYGVVKYSIRDPGTIEGYYISRMSPDLPGRDTATGDASDGFPGHYVLNSREVNGRTWGPHDWILSRRGDIVDLTWRELGRTFCRGLGIVDPHDPSSMIATYIAL